MILPFSPILLTSSPTKHPRACRSLTGIGHRTANSADFRRAQSWAEFTLRCSKTRRAGSVGRTGETGADCKRLQNPNGAPTSLTERWIIGPAVRNDHEKKHCPADCGCLSVLGRGGHRRAKPSGGLAYFQFAQPKRFESVVVLRQRPRPFDQRASRRGA